MRSSLVLALALLITVSARCQSKPKPAEDPEARTAREMESLKSDPLRLREFLLAMPKGGDLHNHLSGAVYAESYLQWAAEEGDCIDTAALSIVKPATLRQCPSGQVTAEAALRNPALYGSLLNAMSMYQYLPEKTHDTGHDHFFATFPRFAAVSQTHWGEMLAEVTKRAADQNEEYLELILGIDRNQAGPYGEKVQWSDGDYAHNYEQALQAGLRDLIPQMRASLDEAERGWRKALDCGSMREKPGCSVQARYIFEIYRGMPAQRVFAQTIAGFELAKADPRVVAVNPVMPEDWYVPMRDYEVHMRMLGFLHERYPTVHITLHAGELAPGLVPYEGLQFHIRSAVQLGHAERIGHGVDIMYEKAEQSTLQEMALRHIAVEINLSSNRLILGVSGKQHPLREYLRAGVPVVLSTDDEGVARSEMTDELIQAVLDQNMSYQELKQAERNSIKYAFVGDATKQKLSQCLEQRFTRFERDRVRTPMPPCAEH